MTIVMEIWKNIIGYEGLYKISNYGKIINKNDYLMNPVIDTSGYFKIKLSNNGLGKTFLVHRLIAKHFINNPNLKPQVNHKNGIKTDNSIANLEWVTNKENRVHAVTNGLHRYNKYNVFDNNKFIGAYTTKDIALMLKIDQSTIRQVGKSGGISRGKYSFQKI